MGKKKIPIEKIENKLSRQVTFTKRRQGIFNKAKTLCDLCGVKIAILSFSAIGTPFAFGHPSVDVVLNHYCKIKIENERKKKQQQLKMVDGEQTGFWWERINLDQVESLEELQNIQTSLMEFRDNVARRLDKLSAPSPVANYDDAFDHHLPPMSTDLCL